MICKSFAGNNLENQEEICFRALADAQTYSLCVTHMNYIVPSLLLFSLNDFNVYTGHAYTQVLLTVNSEILSYKDDEFFLIFLRLYVTTDYLKKIFSYFSFQFLSK